jgi:hypothetical protein
MDKQDWNAARIRELMNDRSRIIGRPVIDDDDFAGNLGGLRHRVIHRSQALP